MFNDLNGVYLYINSLMDAGNNTFDFIIKGAFIYNYRYGFSVENSPNASGVFLVATLPLLVYVYRQASTLKFLYLLFYFITFISFANYRF